MQSAVCSMPMIKPEGKDFKHETTWEESISDDAFSWQIDEILADFNGKKINAKSVSAYIPTGLPLESRVLRQIVDQEDPDMPIMMVDVERIVSQWKRWERLVPRARPYYPVKCNDDPILLRILFKLGARFDCASPAEMRNVLSIGASHDDIIYSNPCKQVTSLQFARARGILFTVFDNIDELYKVAEYMPEARLLMRIRTNDKGAQCPMSAKFGAPPESWLDLIETAKSLGLALIGVHFHVGSGCTSVEAFSTALTDAAEVFRISTEAGFAMEILDIGGGFPGDAVEDVSEGQIQFEEIAGLITPMMDALFPPEVSVISEPGRYFATTSHTLAVKVFSRRAPTDVARQEYHGEAYKSNGKNPNMLYYINDGLYGSFNCVLYDHATIYPEILKSKKSGPCQEIVEREMFPSTIFGQTCDGFDCIIKSVELPKLEVGDWLVFRNMGAYTVAAASTFNGFSKPHTRYVRIVDEERD